jgi:hypothetical protein
MEILVNWSIVFARLALVTVAYSPFMGMALGRNWRNCIKLAALVQLCTMPIIVICGNLKSGFYASPHPWWLYLQAFSAFALIASVVSIVVVLITGNWKNAEAQGIRSWWLLGGHAVIALFDAVAAWIYPRVFLPHFWADDFSWQLLNYLRQVIHVSVRIIITIIFETAANFVRPIGEKSFAVASTMQWILLAIEDTD